MYQLVSKGEFGLSITGCSTQDHISSQNESELNKGVPISSLTVKVKQETLGRINALIMGDVILDDLVPKGTLYQFVKNCEVRFDEDGARSVTFDLSRALLYLHQQSIFHFNLTPNKIMVYENGIKNIFKIFDPDTDELMSLNSGNKKEMTEMHGFFPPEIYAKEPLDPFLVDSFSLGVNLYFVLFGRYPWRGGINSEESTEDMISQMDRKWLSPDHSNVTFTKSCIELLHRLTSRRVVDRWSVKQCLLSEWMSCADDIEKVRVEIKKCEEEKRLRADIEKDEPLPLEPFESKSESKSVKEEVLEILNQSSVNYQEMCIKSDEDETDNKNGGMILHENVNKEDTIPTKISRIKLKVKSVVKRVKLSIRSKIKKTRARLARVASLVTRIHA